MSEIYSPGSIAGPQGPAGPAGSQGSVTALAAATIPNFVERNLFELAKVTPGMQVNAADGLLAAQGNTSVTGLIYCPGATSMVSNLPIDPGMWSGEGVGLYDANGNFLSSLTTSHFSVTGPGAVVNGAAFTLPGTQTYVRFCYVPSWLNGAYLSPAWPEPEAQGMVFTTIAGTATLPPTFQASGLATSASVNSLTSSLSNQIGALAGTVPYFVGRNLFNISAVTRGMQVNASNGLLATQANTTATGFIFCPGATSMATNVPVDPGTFSSGEGFALYDQNLNFISSYTTAHFVTWGDDGAVVNGAAFTLPGTQTYVRFCYVAGWMNNGYSGAPGYPEPESQAAIYTTVAGTALVIAPKLAEMKASALGCALDAVNIFTGQTSSGAQGTDDTALLNAFLATASEANPVRLILDGIACTTGLVIAATGYTTIEGLGWGTGIYVLPQSNQDGIRIGPYTAAVGNSEAPGGGNTPPAQTTTDIILRDFTINANGAGVGWAGGTISGWNTTVANSTTTPANLPAAGAPVHSVYGAIFANAQNILVDHMYFYQPPAYCLCFSNVNNVVVQNSTFFSSAHGSQDGIHIDGPSAHGRIVGCTFTTSDDSIAFNCPEGYGGNIDDWTVDGCSFLNTYRCGRVYTSDSVGTFHASRIRILNSVGTIDAGDAYACWELGIEGGTATSTVDQIEDILFENCNFSGPYGMIILRTPMGSLTVARCTFQPTSTYPVIASEASSVQNLTIDDLLILRNANGSSNPPVFNIQNVTSAACGTVRLRDIRVEDLLGSTYAAIPNLLNFSVAAVAALILEAIDMTHVTALVSGGLGGAIVSGSGVLGTGVQIADASMGNNCLYLSSSAAGAPSIMVNGTARRLTLA
jgi:hypothetical protein